ncbi:MAG: hypothetical protein ACR2KU_09075 [Gammaproteobacteria bacterium]|nr:hypothetical protein [Gammaproteobacteria bacterium]MBA3732617.1 hypothetical protein [Gammaproteobacteria bacterium]
MHVAIGKRLAIADRSKVRHLTYAGLLDFHQGDSWWGLSVGFRALQVAGKVLSREKLWDREHLRITSAHPGPGVRDAIEYVTRCVSRGRFRLACSRDEIRCSRNMRFEWRVSDERETVRVRLRRGFVPDAFFDLLDRVNTPRESPEDRQRFDDFKRELSDRLWHVRLEDPFKVDSLDVDVTGHA